MEHYLIKMHATHQLHMSIHIVKDVSVGDVNLNMDLQHTPIDTPSVYYAQTMGTKLTPVFCSGSATIDSLLYIS